jgi:hypothetical protein
MSFFLFVLKESGVRDIPSMAKIKSFWTKELNMEEMIQRVSNILWL